MGQENSALQQQLAAAEADKADVFGQLSKLQQTHQELTDVRDALEAELKKAKSAAASAGEQQVLGGSSVLLLCLKCVLVCALRVCCR